MALSLSPYQRLSDVALMLRVHNGDERAFEELYHRYYRKLLNFFYGMSRSGQMAEDLCQETFLRVWKLRRRYAATGPFSAYLFAFGRLVWLEEARRLGRHRRFHIPVSEDENWHFFAESPLCCPDEMASRSEILERIFDALDVLPEEQRMVFVLQNIDGMTNEEISLAMQCPVNTVRSRKILAVKKLREALRGLVHSHIES